MPLTREQKEKLVAGYREGLARAPHVFLVDFKGISVPQVTELRARLRESGNSYLVIKNRLARLAVEGAALEGLSDHFEGPVAAAYCDSDPVGLARTLTDFAKEVPALEFKGGLVEGRRVEAAQVREIADMPGREELMARLFFLLQSPVTRFTRTVAELRRRFVVVLDQVRAQKESGGAGG